MFNFDQYKMLMLAALTGYVGTLLNGIPTKIKNFIFYWFGYTISTSTDIGWDSYMGVYMGVRKVVPQHKKYYNHMGALMTIGGSRLYLNSNMIIDGYEYLTDEEKNFLDHENDDKSIFRFMKSHNRRNYNLNKIKALPKGSHLIYLGKLTWINISALVTYKQNTTSSSYATIEPKQQQVNHQIDISIFGIQKSKYMQIFKDSENYWMDYFNGNLKQEEKEVKNFDDLQKVLCLSNQTPYLNITSLKPGGARSYINKPKRDFNSIFINNKQDIINAFDQFLNIQTIKKYKKLQIPYKLNILLYGKPGTGKTSLLYALINEFTTTQTGYIIEDLDCVLYDPLNEGVINPVFDCTSPMFNSELFNDLPNLKFKVHRLNIIEELDTMFGLSLSGNRENTSNNNRSFEDLLSNSSGKLKTILEWLDGSKTPFGNICVCTTNHIERLDPAIVRRFDYIFHIDGITDDVVDEMLAYYGFDRKILEKLNKEDYIMDNNLINPSKLSNLLIKEMKRG